MSEEYATSKVLLDRLNARLPRMLELQRHVDAGAKLDEGEFEFLKELVEDANLSHQYVARHPDLQPLASRLVSLYGQIVEKALENESKG
ncbi:hypothetical protein [Noviluteimonas gilva]|uniref:Uncharacterized protein n=1 Tax=Noviluteimonas gilva TaxID=2682097 RepID=A0A7C9M4G3_9GAMM|nr:hypothetical protein [Lysobacter gilvus]MUV14682.1 hypothetical protein [Lysobacter gilvus]